MVEKPPTADPEQRRRQTEVSRVQSGLPPEPPEEEPVQPRRRRRRPAEVGAGREPDSKGGE